MSNEVTIEAMNLAIVEFMQVEKDHHSYLTGGRFRTTYLVNGHWLPLRKLKYHTSWDWIVPVYKKIKSMHLDILKQSFVMQYMHAAGPMNSAWSFVDIEKLHKGIYQFITWYNDNQQKQNNG